MTDLRLVEVASRYSWWAYKDTLPPSIESKGHHKTVESRHTTARISFLPDLTVIAFRGTQTSGDGKRLIFDALFNLRMKLTEFEGKGKVSSGFLQKWRSVWPQIRETVASTPSKNPILCTGHSSGGCMAQMTAQILATSGKKKVHVVTFGSPKAGDMEFARALKSAVESIQHLRNRSDPIPSLPPQKMGYFHTDYSGSAAHLTGGWLYTFSGFYIITFLLLTCFFPRVRIVLLSMIVLILVSLIALRVLTSKSHSVGSYCHS